MTCEVLEGRSAQSVLQRPMVLRLIQELDSACRLRCNVSHRFRVAPCSGKVFRGSFRAMNEAVAGVKHVMNLSSQGARGREHAPPHVFGGVRLRVCHSFATASRAAA